MLPELHTGDHVRIKHKTDTWKQKATVLNEVKPRSYDICTEEGVVLRRNPRDLLGPTAAVERASAIEQPQHTLEKTPEIPVQCHEPIPRRSSRKAKPPERLTEQI